MLSGKKGKECKSSPLFTSLDLFPAYTGSGWVNFLCGLCFGFVTKTVGNTLLFWLLLSVTGRVSRLPGTPGEQAGVSKKLEGPWLGQPGLK